MVRVRIAAGPRTVRRQMQQQTSQTANAQTQRSTGASRQRGMPMPHLTTTVPPPTHVVTVPTHACAGCLRFCFAMQKCCSQQWCRCQAQMVRMLQACFGAWQACAFAAQHARAQGAACAGKARCGSGGARAGVVVVVFQSTGTITHATNQTRHMYNRQVAGRRTGKRARVHHPKWQR